MDSLRVAFQDTSTLRRVQYLNHPFPPACPMPPPLEPRSHQPGMPRRTARKHPAHPSLTFTPRTSRSFRGDFEIMAEGPVEWFSTIRRLCSRSRRGTNQDPRGPCARVRPDAADHLERLDYPPIAEAPENASVCCACRLGSIARWSYRDSRRASLQSEHARANQFASWPAAGTRIDFHP